MFIWEFRVAVLYIYSYSFTADTAISQVKLGELPGWIGRRSMDPLSMVRAVGRSKYYQFGYVCKHCLNILIKSYLAVKNELARCI